MLLRTILLLGISFSVVGAQAQAIQGSVPESVSGADIDRLRATIASGFAPYEVVNIHDLYSGSPGWLCGHLETLSDKDNGEDRVPFKFDTRQGVLTLYNKKRMNELAARLISVVDDLKVCLDPSDK